MKKELQGCFIADLHIGNRRSHPQQTKYELEESFFPIMEKNNFDIVVIGGDLFHKKFSINSEAAQIGVWFLDKLLEYNTYILYVHGTRSHDDNQIDIYSYKQNDKFRIYKTACVDNIQGYSFLILPEEYVYNPKKYYHSFLHPKEKYDLCFGHGMLSFACPYVNNLSDSIEVSFVANIFDTKDIQNCVKGPSMFGHVHKRMDKNNVHYSGSFSRYAFGEEEKKGFYSFSYNKNNSKFSMQFHENKHAPTYKTIHVKEFEALTLKEIEVFINKISKKYNYIRLMIESNFDENKRNHIINISKSKGNIIIKPIKIKNNLPKDQLQNIENTIKKYSKKDWKTLTIEYAKNELKENITEDDIDEALKTI